MIESSHARRVSVFKCFRPFPCQTRKIVYQQKTGVEFKSGINKITVDFRIYLIQHVLIVPLYLFRRNIIFCETVLRSSDSYYIVFSE